MTLLYRDLLPKTGESIMAAKRCRLIKQKLIWKWDPDRLVWCSGVVLLQVVMFKFGTQTTPARTQTVLPPGDYISSPPLTSCPRRTVTINTHCLLSSSEKPKHTWNDDTHQIDSAVLCATHTRQGVAHAEVIVLKGRHAPLISGLYTL
jgi:hypothetical protein